MWEMSIGSKEYSIKEELENKSWLTKIWNTTVKIIDGLQNILG